MNNAKFSRRKQTRPNRVPFGSDSGGHLPVKSTVSELTPSRALGADLSSNDFSSSRAAERRSDASPSNDESPLDLHVPLLSGKVCSEASTLSRQTTHQLVDTAHNSSSKENEFQFPTKYHRLGSQLLHENSQFLNGYPDGECGVLTSSNVNDVKTHSNSNVRPSSHDFLQLSLEHDDGRPARPGAIFHPDAYCELCNREFCNKYFLRTHKAVKHDTVDADPSVICSRLPACIDNFSGSFHSNFGLSQSSSTPVISHYSGLFSSTPDDADAPAGKMSSKRQFSTPHMSRRLFSPDCCRSPVTSPLPSTASSQSTSINQDRDSQIVSSVITAVMNGMSDADPGMISPSGYTNSGSSLVGMRESSMEDYCEICQKHFCNKYYLKKHKQDVHGITPESGPTPMKRNRTGSHLFDVQMSSSLSSPIGLLPQPIGNLHGMPTLPHNAMILSPFMPHMPLLPPGSIPQPFTPGAGILPSSHTSSLVSHALNPHGTLADFSSNSLPSLVCQLPMFSQSAETFCKVCCKAFSSHYFLRMHNASCHGMLAENLPPEAKILSEIVQSNCALNQRGSISTKSFNLDMLNHCRDSSSPGHSSSSVEKVTCQTFMKDFPSSHTSRLHNASENGKGDTPANCENVENKKPVPVPFAVNSTSSYMFQERSYAGRRQANTTSHCQDILGFPVPPHVGNESTSESFCNIKNSNATCHMQTSKINTGGLDFCRNELMELDKEDIRTCKYDSNARVSPGSPACKGFQPLNMTTSSLCASSPTDSSRIHASLSAKDFAEYARELSLMETYGPLKNVNGFPAFFSHAFNNDSMRFPQPQIPFKNVDFRLRSLGTPLTPNINHNQLMDGGIDPEAYCDICKKEFCSKYFLRTHKQNIHGIKLEPTAHDRSGRSKLCAFKPLICRPVAPVLNTVFSFAAEPPMSVISSSFPPSLTAFSTHLSYGCGPETSDKQVGQFRSLSANTSQRVICDICNKEVCNKYFLRTHKQKKHGILFNETSSSLGSGSPGPSDNDASSNHSSLADNFALLEKGSSSILYNHRAENTDVTIGIPLPLSQISSSGDDVWKVKSSVYDKCQLRMQPDTDAGVSEMNNPETGVRCSLCNIEFRDTHWLEAHVIRDHDVKPSLLQNVSPFCSNSRIKDLSSGHPVVVSSHQPDVDSNRRICPMCYGFLPNDISLRLHMLEEHDVDNKCRSDEVQRCSYGAATSLGRSRDPWKYSLTRSCARRLRCRRMYACFLCSYHTHWLVNMRSHDKHVHLPGIDSEVRSSSTSKDVLAATVSGDSGSLRRCTCKLCGRRFSSHSRCLSHVRLTHIRNRKDFVIRRRSCLQRFLSGSHVSKMAARSTLRGCHSHRQIYSSQTPVGLPMSLRQDVMKLSDPQLLRDYVYDQSALGVHSHVAQMANEKRHSNYLFALPGPSRVHEAISASTCRLAEVRP